MLKRILEFRKRRKEKVNEAREKFVSFLEICDTKGFKSYEKEIEKKIEIIVSKFKNDTTLNPEELKRLQLAYQVYCEIQRIPKLLKDNARGGK